MRTGSSQAPPRVATAWLAGPLFDLTFILGIALLATVMSGITVLWPLWFLPMLSAHTWLFGYDHLLSTYTKLAGSPQERAKNWRLMWLLPPLVLLLLSAVGKTSGIDGLYLLYFVGQFFHTVRQSWGLAQQYRHRAGGLPYKVKKVKILRDKKEVMHDIRQIRPDGSNNPVLKDGDEVIVPD